MAGKPPKKATGGSPSPVRRGEVNTVACATHKDCKLPEAYRRRKEVVDFYRSKLPEMTRTARLCRLAAFIDDVANSGHKPKGWCSEVVDFAEFAPMRESRKRWLSKLQDQVDARVSDYLTFVEDEVVPDLLRWHPHEQQRITAALGVIEGVVRIPAPGMYRWFEEKVYTGIQNGNNSWSRIFSFGTLKRASWDVYKKVIVEVSPMLVWLAQRRERGMLAFATRVLAPESIFGSNAITTGSTKVSLFQILELKKGKAFTAAAEQATGTCELKVVQFNVAKNLYHIPLISGTLAAIAVVFTCRDLAKDRSLNNLLKSAAAVSALGQSLADVIVTRTIRGRDLTVRISMGASAESVKIVTVASKVFSTGAYLLGAAAAAVDAYDFYAAGDENAALFALVGALGLLLMALPGVGWALTGIVLTIGGAIGVTMCADEELIKWAKKSPYGTAPAKDSAEDSERKLYDVLWHIRCRAADQLDAEIRQLRHANAYILERLNRGLSPWQDAPKTALDEQDARVKCTQNEKLANGKYLEASCLRLKMQIPCGPWSSPKQ